MIRRARLSFKPNVRPSGRSVGSGARDASSASQPEEPVQHADITVTAGPEENDKSIGDGSTPCEADSEEPQRGPDIPEKSSGASRENEPSKPATAPLQRRKRISTLPNLAKPRVSSSAPVTASQKPQQVESPPTLPVSSVPSIDEVSSPEKAKVPSSAKSQGSNSAPQGQHVTLPEKRTPIPQVPQFSPLKKSSLKQSEMNPVKSVDFIQKEEFSPLKERPSQKSSSNEYKKITPKKLVASGNLEKERLRRAQKLRELLKDEVRKERKEWKAKHPVLINTGDQERSKMLMRDFIYFIPSGNPMTATFADTRSSEKAPPESPPSGTPVKNINNDEDDDLVEEEDESQLLAPRVKVAEDGSIILDEESLTVEVCRSKAPIVEGNDPIFERGSTTTYSSFRKSNYSKPWSVEETEMFFLAISMVGTDFSMIGQLFPHRERIEIKNKFKREERTNSWRIDKAFRETTSFDFEFFSKRLERALEATKRKRAAPKFKQPREKKATKPRKKQKDKASTEQVLSDGEMAVLSDGEGADARTEEKENEGSVSVEKCLLPSDNVPGKKRRSRKKHNDTKVPEEETLPSLPEDTTTLPKKPKKRRAADQVIDSKLAVDDENHEDVPTAPDTVQEKKKKSRKKKPTDKETEADNSEDADIINVASPRRDRVDEKSTSSVLPDDGDSLMCRESEEPSFTQSEALTCAEDSSLILFTEESECFSEPDDISSLQESLSVVPGSQTLADLTGTFDDAPLETSQEDSVFESSHHLTSDSPKQVPLEEDMAADRQTGTKVEGSTESQKDSPKPAAPTRSRFQKPRPNMPMRTLARKENILLPAKSEITEEGNKVTAGNSLSQSQQKDISRTENPNGKELELLVSERKDDIPCPVQKNTSSESSQLQPGHSEILSPEFATAKKDKSKENPLPVRGRLVRPKPNLKKAPAKDKPPASEPKSPKSDSQDPGEIATAPCSVVLTPLCTSVNEEAKTESSTSSQEQGTTSTIKPTPLVHGCLQRPKPNTVRASRKEKSKDMEDSEQCDDVSAEVSTQDISSNVASPIQNDAAIKHEEKDNKSTNKDPHLDFGNVQNSCIPIKETFSKPCLSVQEVIPEPDPAVIPVSESKAENKKSPIKLARGLLQRPKPNLLKSCDRKGISEMREENVDVTSENTEENLKGKIRDLSDLGKPTDFVKEVPTSDESCSHQENRLNLAQMDQVLPGDLKPKDGINTSEEVQKPAKPAVLTRGRLQRPKPNLGRALPKRGVLSSSDDSRNESKVEASDKPPESSHSAASLSPFEAGKAHVRAKTAADDMPFKEEITQSDVPCKTTIGRPGVDQVESEESLPMSVDDSAIKKTLSSSEDEKSAATTKPALTWNRLQRPKPNLGRSVICPTASSPQKCDVHEEGKNREDGSNTSPLENVLQYDTENTPVLANTHTEEITQSYILPLETVFLPGVNQVDSEEPPSVSVDHSSHVTIKKDLSTTKDERMVEASPALTKSRLQRPKPNLGRTATRTSVSAPEKCNDEERKSTKDSIDTSPIEKGPISSDKQNMDLSPKSCPAEGHDIQLCTEETQGGSVVESARLDESSSTVEQVEGPSLKPLRNRLQKPKPNLGRASVRKESRAFASEQKEVNVVSSSKIPEHLESKGGPDLAIGKDVAGDREESAHTTIKPAQLKRGRPMRPVPSLGMPPNKRPNVLQSKTVHEEAADKNLEVMSSKRKFPECFPDVSSKRSCSPDQSQSSSDSTSDKVLSTSALHDSSQSNDIQEDVLKQHSRFGRPLKRPVSTTPPVLTKPSENVSERPEKEKTSRSVKSVKSKVTKPTSSKGKGKTTLVKIRAMKQDEDEEEDDADLEFEDEDYDIEPDKLNQAPVFVPFRLRSPKPVPAEIEETVEELEIPVEDFGVPDSTAQSLTPNPTLQDVSQHMPVASAHPDNKGLCDGSTEAAMTLISIGNSVFQSKLASTLTVQMVRAAEDDTTLNSRPVKIGHDILDLQEGNGALSVSTDEQSNDLVISDLHTSTQSSHLLNVNVPLPLENISHPSMQQNAQQQDCSASDRLLEDSVSGEETTFILTLVEIPVSEGYSYSCDETSVDVLPAPVLITSSSSQMLTPDQSPGNAASSEPSSSQFCQSGQREAKLMQNTPSRKRCVRVSSEENEPQPSKKAFLCTSPEQGEDSRPNTAAFEENENSSSMPAEIKTKETEASHQSSIDIASSSTGEEKVQECTSPIEKSATASCNSPSRLLPSSSSTPLQQRPGKKPLGFLSLVCKEKQLKKTKVTSKKKILKPKCKKNKVQESEEENSTGIPEDATSSEVPSQSLSSADASTPTNTETIPSTCQDSENLDSKDFSENPETITQESPKSQDLASEEEAAAVSEYFFNDIFMEVDE